MAGKCVVCEQRETMVEGKTSQKSEGTPEQESLNWMLGIFRRGGGLLAVKEKNGKGFVSSQESILSQCLERSVGTGKKYRVESLEKEVLIYGRVGEQG